MIWVEMSTAEGVVYLRQVGQGIAPMPGAFG